MLTAIAGQGSTDGAAAAASHLPDCKAHRDTFPLPLCLSLCICNSAFPWAFIEHVTDAARLRLRRSANNRTATCSFTEETQEGPPPKKVYLEHVSVGSDLKQFNMPGSPKAARL